MTVILLNYFNYPLTFACAHGLRAVPLGHSLEMVLSNIREDTFAHRAFYIALSRIHRLDDLMLFAIETSPIGGPIIHVNQCHPRWNGPMGRGRWGSPNSHYLDLLARSCWSCCYYTPDLWHPQALMTVVLLNYSNSPLTFACATTVHKDQWHSLGKVVIIIRWSWWPYVVWHWNFAHCLPYNSRQSIDFEPMSPWQYSPQSRIIILHSIVFSK